MAESKYPKGLLFLVFTEFWERFGYYLMIGIFFLYMTTDAKDGGMGWENTTASDIFGTFIALAYLTPFMGGLLADLKLGYRFSITLGGILMGIGYCMLAIPEKWAFYSALAIMVVGNGFFKPNISTLLGNLFNDPRYKSKKDTGYNIFYMGINLGAFICNFIAAIMRNKIGWHGAFLTAGLGMFLGVITFWMGMKHYKHVDVRKEPKPEDKPLLIQFVKILIAGVIFAIFGWIIPGTIMGSDSTDAFFMFCIPVIYFYASIYKKANAEERKPLGTMFTIFIIVILFWAIFKQNGTALTTYAEYYTDRESPPQITAVTEKLGFSERLIADNKEVNQVDEQFRKIKGADGNVMKCNDYPLYFKNIDASKMPAKGESVNLVNTEIFQSVNPFFVVILTPIIIAFFAFMRKRKKEPTTASKIAYGLLISALSTLVMVGAVYFTDNGMDKASAWWLISSYGVITVGELLLSPMGLSMVSKLAPLRLTALMMGGWQLATSMGNKLSGVLAKNWDKFDNKANYFWLNFALLMFAFCVMMFLLKRLNKVFHEGKEN
ncbi:MAG: peptide MFS transporter [Bacteroidota bacterium]|nr:peptide MFS transporter [Bacteroidota bacterium]MDP3144502.1 peptide MFS transporter [Bacteroidota bacterium]MDP3555817.1 peptide MFS transporter [Bacteroidota bacterium]